MIQLLSKKYFAVTAIIIFFSGCGNEVGSRCRYQNFSQKFELVAQKNERDGLRYIFQPIDKEKFQWTIDLDQYSFNQSFESGSDEIQIGDELIITGKKIAMGSCKPYHIERIQK